MASPGIVFLYTCPLSLAMVDTFYQPFTYCWRDTSEQLSLKLKVSVNPHYTQVLTVSKCFSHSLCDGVCVVY